MKKLLLLLLFPIFLGSTSKYQYKYEMPFAPVIYQGINDSIPTIDQFGRIRNGIIAQRIIDTMNNDPSGVDLTRAEQDYVRSIVGGLYVTGMWQRTTAMYPFVGGNAWKHKWNWKDMRDLDAAFRLVFSGGLTHSNAGIQVDGNTGFANSFLNPSTSLTLNNTHISGYQKRNESTITANGISTIAGSALSSNTFCLFYRTNNTTQSSIATRHYESPPTPLINTPLITKLNLGFILTNKTTSTSVDIYYDNNIFTGSQSGSLPNTNLELFRTGSGNYSSLTHSFVSIGSGLTDQIAITSSQVITYSEGILNRQ